MRKLDLTLKDGTKVIHEVAADDTLTAFAAWHDSDGTDRFTLGGRMYDRSDIKSFIVHRSVG